MGLSDFFWQYSIAIIDCLDQIGDSRWPHATFWIGSKNIEPSNRWSSYIYEKIKIHGQSVLGFSSFYFIRSLERLEKTKAILFR